MSRSAELGETVGGYVLESVLGTGGMGVVFLGRHHLLGRKAAIKVLDSELAGHEQLVSRFFHEAKIVNDVRHPNIVDVIDFVRTKSPRRVAFVMEYLEGEPLDRTVKKGPLSIYQTINVMIQVVDGLRAVHEIGVIHRDLKPANLRFTRTEIGDCSAVPVLKILDFGIAKASSGNVGHKTQTGIVMGTPAYMAPEQVSGDPVSRETDVYAVGEILYELLSGQRLFVGTNTEMLRAKLAPKPPKVALPEMPSRPALGTLIRDCLASEPQGRPSTREVLARLRALRDGLTTGPVPVGFEERKATTLLPTGAQRVTTATLEPHVPAATPAPATPAPRPQEAAPPTPAGRRAATFSPPAITSPESIYMAPPPRRGWIVASILLLMGALIIAGLTFLKRQPEKIVAVQLEDEPAPKRIAAVKPPPSAETPKPPPEVRTPPVDPKGAVEPTRDQERKKKRRRSTQRRTKSSKKKAEPPSALKKKVETPIEPPPKVEPPPVETPPIKAPPVEPPSPRFGRLAVTAWTTAGRQVPAKVKIDGKAIRRAAPFEIKARVGRRTILVEAVGHPAVRRKIEIKDGKTTKVDVVVDLQ